MEELTDTVKEILNRRTVRVKVMQAIYARQTSGNEPSFIYKHLLEDTFQALRKTYLSNPGKDDDSKFLSELFFDSLKKKDELETWVKSKIENWDYQRIAVIDRIILIMGLYEMMYCKEVPVKVTINEYVDIAKEYSTEKSNHFVNGILDALYEDMNSKGLIVKTGKGLIDR